MYAIIFLLAAATTAIIVLVAIWAARSSLHWFWRAAGLLTCFVLLVPVGAAELNLLFMPLAGILFLASAGQQWWERRRKIAAGDGSRGRESIRAEDPPIPATTDPNRLPTPAFRFSLKELFLVLLLSAVAAWVVVRIVHEGVVLDWRKLPIALALVAGVSWIAFWWADKPRPWRGGYAISIAYLLGFAMAAWLVYALPYWFNWHSTKHIAIATVIISLATIALVYLWLVHVGRIRQTVVLAATIYGAAWIHLNYLGDWLQADHLLVQRWPPFAYLWGVLYGYVYSILAVFVILGVLLGKGAALPSWESRRNFVLSRLSVAGLVSLLVPVAWQYWQLLEIPRYKSPSAGMTINSLPEANRILLELRQARKSAEENAPAAGKELSVNDEPDVQRLTRELFIILEKPGGVWRHWDTPEEEEAIDGQIKEAWALLEISAELLGRNGDPPNDDYDAWSDYALACARYANYSQRGALAAEAWQGYVMETGGHIWLARNRKRLSPACQRKLLAALRELDRAREPIDVILAREAAWSERHERWRSRLRRVVLEVEARSVDTIVRTRDMPSVRTMHDRCLLFARLNMTEMAIAFYRQEHGRLPTELSELVPDYLDGVPIDPYSGEALVYRVAKDTYLLYSVGPDGEDDGGSVAGLEFQYQSAYYGYAYDGDIVLQTLIEKLEAALARVPPAVPAPRAKKLPAAQTGRNSKTPANP